MTRDELLDALVEIARECGRAAADDIREAAGVPLINTDDKHGPQMRQFIIQTLKESA